MREFVYLSDTKLRQFISEPRRFSPRATVKFITPFGGVDLEPGPDPVRSRLQHLKQVIRQVERTARWFTEPGLFAGEWVQFEAPLNHLVLDGGFRDMLLFVDPPVPVDGYPSAGRVRLLMHGSARHLLLLHQPGPGEESRAPEDVTELPPSSESGYGASYTRLVARDGGALPPVPGLRPAPHDPAVAGQLPADGATATPVTAAQSMALGTQVLLAAIDPRLSPETAVWMRGYARMTADLSQPGGSRCVVASPLYVEYAHDFR